MIPLDKADIFSYCSVYCSF